VNLGCRSSICSINAVAQFERVAEALCRRAAQCSTDARIYESEDRGDDSTDKYIRRASATASASLNVLPNWICSAVILIKLKSNIERHSQSKLARNPLAFKARPLPKMAM